MGATDLGALTRACKNKGGWGQSVLLLQGRESVENKTQNTEVLQGRGDEKMGAHARSKVGRSN